MKKPLASLTTGVAGIVCFVGAWKICEAGNSNWPWFLIAGIATAILSCSVAAVPDDEKENDL